MFEEDFVNRLIKLRIAKNVSARDMSLSIGQNPSYINQIELGKALPSMAVFFCICDYLGVTPSEFFDTESNHTERIKKILPNLKNLTDNQFEHIAAIIEAFNTQK